MGYKLKTNKAASKRFQVKKGGKVKFRKVGARHRALAKSPERNRRARGTGHLANMDAKKVKELFPYSRT